MISYSGEHNNSNSPEYGTEEKCEEHKSEVELMCQLDQWFAQEHEDDGIAWWTQQLQEVFDRRVGLPRDVGLWKIRKI